MRTFLTVGFLLLAAAPARAASAGKEGECHDKHCAPVPRCLGAAPTCSQSKWAVCDSGVWRCIGGCSNPRCPSPKEGCHYAPAAVGSDGCATSCGELICDDACPDPAPKCAFPRKAFCEADGWTCRKDCVGGPPPCAYPRTGVCEDGSWSCKEIKCPALDCPEVALRQGCRYGERKKDRNGCFVGCPQLVCDRCSDAVPPCAYPKTAVCVDGSWTCRGGRCGDDPPPCAYPASAACEGDRWVCKSPKCAGSPPFGCQNPQCAADGTWQCAAVICPAVDCAQPPAGCVYGERPVDVNGCATGCGDIACPHNGGFNEKAAPKSLK